MLSRLEDTFESQKRFVANASHELRTPLATIGTSVDVVLAKPRPTKEQWVTMAHNVRAATDRAERLIESLLVLARSERGLAEHDRVDLAESATEA